MRTLRPFIERYRPDANPERVDPRADIATSAFGPDRQPSIIWRVLRTSVPWQDTEAQRLAERQRLVCDRDSLPCLVLGFDRAWWYVALDTKATYTTLLDRASVPCPDCAPDHYGVWNESQRRWVVCKRCGGHGRILP